MDIFIENRGIYFKRITNLIGFFLLLFIFLTAKPVSAQSGSSENLNRLVIATTDNGPISIDRLLYVALRDIRYNVVFVCPIIREGYIQANDGTCDGVIAAYPGLDSVYTNLRQVPIPLERINVRVFAREDSNIQINSWNDLAGMRIGILENRTYILERLPRDVRITEKETNRAVLNGIVNGEYDAAVLVERDHETLGDRLHVKRVGKVDELVEYLYLNKKHEVLIPLLAAALQNMNNNGSANLILNDLPIPDLNHRKTIVHIISQNIEIDKEEQFSAELKDRFENDMSIEWMTVNLDAMRFTRGQYNIAHIASLLRMDSVSRNVAAVIVSGETALEFLKDYYYLYFRNTPVLFYGVGERYYEIIQDNEHFFTGIIKNIEADLTMETALSIFPNTKNIFVLNDYTAEGIENKNIIADQLAALNGRVNIEYNENMNITYLMAKINSLPKDSLVLVGSYFVDADYQYYSMSEMKRLLERNCAVPILSVYSADLAYNAIGGKSPDYKLYGEKIADMLEKLLAGVKAEDIPIVFDSSGYNRWVFDQIQMDRFDIKPKDLPPDAEIINRIPSIWESNPEFFIAMIILLTISILLIVGTSVFFVVNDKYNKHLKEMEETAIAASRAKSNFLANMSHEMRTPLTAVIGLTELTLETVQLDEETHSNLVKVYRAGETLLSLINDILDISKIEADKFELNPIEYDVPSLLNDTITQSLLYIGEKPIEFVLDINEDLPHCLYGDELRIKQILNNLLSNAFKFTKKGIVELGVRSSRDGDSVWLSAWVRDSGVGIKPEDIKKLFTLYSRMEEDKREENSRTKGTGLGLSISKRVAQMMDGSVTVESEYGKGSTFTVKLRQKFVNDTVIGPVVAENLKKFHYTIDKFEKAKVSRINLSYVQVLVVDDNPTNLDVAKGLMSLYGMKIDCVTSGQQAIDIIRAQKVKYNAIFMDHMMPEMDGIEATRIIREINTEYAKSIPIIALTANAVVGNEEMFLNKGFQAFISKPIDLAHLDAVLRQWVRDKELESRLPEQEIQIEVVSKKEKKIFTKNIDGLDIDKGIANFGFKEETYFKILKSYAKNTKPLLDTIREVNMRALSDYALIVHGIKGSSYGIFAKDAGDQAHALEIAAKNKDIEFVKNNNQKFIDTISDLITNIENIENNTEQKQIKERPDEMQLARLLGACQSFDIDEMDAAMTEIEKNNYTSDNGLAVWLREKLDQGKYNEIRVKILEVMNG